MMLIITARPLSIVINPLSTVIASRFSSVDVLFRFLAFLLRPKLLHVTRNVHIVGLILESEATLYSPWYVFLKAWHLSGSDVCTFMCYTVDRVISEMRIPPLIRDSNVWSQLHGRKSVQNYLWNEDTSFNWNTLFMLSYDVCNTEIPLFLLEVLCWLSLLSFHNIVFVTRSGISSTNNHYKCVIISSLEGLYMRGSAWQLLGEILLRHK